MNQATPEDRVRSLMAQQSNLLASKALLTEQLEATDKAIAEIRAVLQGVELGQSLASQEAAPASEEAPSA